MDSAVSPQDCLVLGTVAQCHQRQGKKGRARRQNKASAALLCSSGSKQLFQPVTLLATWKMKNKCVWTDTNTFANSQNKPGGGEHGWRVTELLCSLAASTPLLPLTTNQKNCFLACQDPGMKSMNCP